MATYSMKIDLPDDVKQFFSGLDGQAKIVGITDDGTRVAVQFEHDGDSYDLAFRALAITDEAARFVGESLDFSRPKELT